MEENPNNSTLYLRSTISERALIGLLLRYPDEAVAQQILSTTNVEDFTLPPCRAIRYALENLGEGASYDASLIAARLQANGDLETTVTADFLKAAYTHAPLPSTASGHVENLKTYRASRLIQEDLSSVMEKLPRESSSPKRLTELVGETITSLNDALVGVSQDEWKPAKDILDDLLNGEGNQFDEIFSTGIDVMDEALDGGYTTGTLNVIAARPGFGKSTLALDIARHNAIHCGVGVAFFSLEMRKPEVMRRALGAETSISHSKIKKRELSDAEQATIAEHVPQISDAPLYIDDRENLTPQDIRASLARMNAHHKLTHDEPIKIVIIDYLQLMSPPGKMESRQREVSEVSRQLKILAGADEGYVVIALAQLNRGSDKRDVEHRPSVRDLRESGSIEQDSDTVTLLGREEDSEDEVSRGQMLGIVGKARNSGQGEFPLVLIPHYPRFESGVVSEDDDSLSPFAGESW